MTGDPLPIIDRDEYEAARSDPLTRQLHNEAREVLMGNESELGEVTVERNELAHALYTVWMHAGQPTEGLIADRIRGALERSPTLSNYEQLTVLRVRGQAPSTGSGD